MNLLQLIEQALAGAQLSAPELAKRLADAAAQLPPGATQDEINAFVQQQLASAFSVSNVAAAESAVMAAAAKFFTSGEGPVQKSPTDLVG